MVNDLVGQNANTTWRIHQGSGRRCSAAAHARQCQALPLHDGAQAGTHQVTLTVADWLHHLELLRMPADASP